MSEIGESDGIVVFGKDQVLVSGIVNGEIVVDIRLNLCFVKRHQ